MSDVSNSLDKLFSFITSANMGFVLLFFLAIYPVYMWSVLSDIDALPRSVSYNAKVLSVASGKIDPDNIVVGNNHCVGRACQRYVDGTVASQIAGKARSSIPTHVIFSLLGTVFVVFSASLWWAIIIGVKNNGKLILLLGVIVSLPAAVVIFGPDKHKPVIRFCAEPTVYVQDYDFLGNPRGSGTVPVCQRI